jgi:hypothetical protein
VFRCDDATPSIRVPDELRIGPFSYKISRVERLDDSGKELYGHVTFGEDIIQISSRFNHRRATVALLHEIIHGIDDLFMLGLSEREVDCLAKGLVMVLEQNGLRVERELASSGDRT